MLLCDQEHYFLVVIESFAKSMKRSCYVNSVLLVNEIAKVVRDRARRIIAALSWSGLGGQERRLRGRIEALGGGYTCPARPYDFGGKLFHLTKFSHLVSVIRKATHINYFDPHPSFPKLEQRIHEPICHHT